MRVEKAVTAVWVRTGLSEMNQHDNTDLPLSHQVSLHQNEEEQTHFDDVCRAFRQYAAFSQSQLKNQQHRLNALPDSQKSVLPLALRPGTLEAKDRESRFREAYVRNQFCLDLILRHAGVPHSQEIGPLGFQKFSSDEHFSKVSSVLKSLARDWSTDGQAERDAAYNPLLESIQKVLPPSNVSSLPPKLCVPGAGVGRLALELSARGYSVQGNEFSLFMLLASDFMLNGRVCDGNRALEISPWLAETKNVTSPSDPTRTVQIPDSDPYLILGQGPNQSTREFSMAAGDFCAIYNKAEERGKWDGVVCCFFLDAAPNIVEFLQIIYNMLRDGGCLFSFGPLLYHWSGPLMRPDDLSREDYQKRFHYMDRRYLDSVDLCWEDVRSIIINIGFVIEKENLGIQATYTANDRSMMNTSYRCVHFVARKKGVRDSLAR